MKKTHGKTMGIWNTFPWKTHEFFHGNVFQIPMVFPWVFFIIPMGNFRTGNYLHPKLYNILKVLSYLRKISNFFFFLQKKKKDFSLAINNLQLLRVYLKQLYKNIYNYTFSTISIRFYLKL